MTSFQHQTPAGGVTEIRVHGVGGSSPAAMLGRSDLIQVSGDEISGFYRSTESDGGHTLEAYSWGGLTARSASRALWVLMLPFSLVNLAGWMIEPVREGGDLTTEKSFFATVDRAICRLGRRLPRRTSGGVEKFQRWLVHLLGLAFTATYVQLAAYLAIDLFATQCGSNERCWRRLPVRSIFETTPEIGRRLVLGVAIPVALLLLFLFLARRSRLSYEAYRPQVTTGAAEPSARSPLEDPYIWDRVGYQKVMASLHGSTCIGGLLWTLGGTAFGLSGSSNSIADMAMRAGVALVGASAFLVMWISVRDASEDSGWRRVAQVLFWAGWVLLLILVFAVWGLQTEGPVETSPWFSRAPLLLLTIAIGIGFVLALSQVLRWIAECYLHSDQFVVVLAALAVALFPRPSVLAVAASALLLMNLAAPSTEGRRTAFVDLGLLVLVALGGWAAAHWLKQPAYLCFGIAVSAVAAAFLWLARRPDPGFRWAGCGAIGAFSAMMLLGIFSGLILRVSRWLSEDGFQIVYPGFYDWALVGVTFTLIVVAFASVLYVLRVLVVDGIPWYRRTKERLIGAGYREEICVRPSRKAASFRCVSIAVRSVDVLITLAGTVLFAAGLTGVVKMVNQDVPFAEWFERPFPIVWSWVRNLAAWLAISAVVGAYAVVRSGMRSETTRRKLAVVWDVASFFPRSFHPLAPPSYAARAVPEIQARIQEAVKKDGRILLAGHSQGSVIATAVLASLPDEAAKKAALVTYGSPLGTFYRPFFPRAFPPEMVQRVAAKTGPGTSLWWANFHRLTDPVSTPAFRTGEVGHRRLSPEVVEVLRGRGMAAREGDVELQDPWETTVSNFRPLPPVRVHMGYESDPAWSGTVKALAELL